MYAQGKTVRKRLQVQMQASERIEEDEQRRGQYIAKVFEAMLEEGAFHSFPGL